MRKKKTSLKAAKIILLRTSFQNSNAKWYENTYRLVTFHISVATLASWDFRTNKQAMQNEMQINITEICE